MLVDKRCKKCNKRMAAPVDAADDPEPYCDDCKTACLHEVDKYKYVGQRSEEDPPHEVTAGELRKLLEHPGFDPDKPISVQVPMGWAKISFAILNNGSLHLHLSEEWT